MSTNGSTIHAVWRANDNEPGVESHIVYRRSKNNGISWETPIDLYNAANFNDIGNVRDGSGPILCVAGSQIHIAVTRAIGSPWHYEIVYIHSANGGLSFDKPRIVFTGNDAWKIADTRIACQGNGITVGFSYYFGPPHQIVALNSEDNGATFTPTTAAGNSNNDSVSLYDLKRDGKNLYLLHDYNTDWPTGEKFLNIAVSNNSGQSFNNHRLTTPAADGNYYSYQAQDAYYQPHLAVSGTSIYAVWTQNDIYYGYNGEDPNGRALYFAASRDYGKTFQTPVKLSEGIPGEQIAQGLETLAAKGNYVYVLFPTRDGRVMLRRSNKKGAAFAPLQDVSRATGGWWSQLAIDPADTTGATVHVLTNINYAVSRNGGKNFSTPLQVFPYDLSWERPKLALGTKGVVYAAGIGSFYSSEVCGGRCDSDVLFRRLPPAPTTAIVGKGLRIKTVHAPFESRLDNMQVAHGPWLDFKQTMTLELWVKPLGLGETTGTSLQWVPILHKQQGLSNSASSYAPSYEIATQDYQGKRLLVAEIATTKGLSVISGDPAKSRSFLPYQVWTHLALTYDAGAAQNNIKLYKNGQLAASGTAAGNIAAGIGNLFVGRYGDIIVDEVRLWNKALTQEEIMSHIDIPLIGNEDGLAAYYPFEKTTRDQTGHGNDGILMYKEQFLTGKQ